MAETVRACTIRYEQQYRGAEAGRRAIQYHKKRGFLWIDELSGVLARYEAQRDKYPTLESFVPELVAFFNQYAERVEKEQASSAHR